MGQSPCSGGGSFLKSSSSCNSATRLLHSFLCFGLCFFLQAALQYVVSLHLLQVFRLLPSLPQLAHTSILSASNVLFMCCASNIDLCLCRWINLRTRQLTTKITMYNHMMEIDVGLLLRQEKDSPVKPNHSKNLILTSENIYIWNCPCSNKICLASQHWLNCYVCRPHFIQSNTAATRLLLIERTLKTDVVN